MRRPLAWKNLSTPRDAYGRMGAKMHHGDDSASTWHSLMDHPFASAVGLRVAIAHTQVARLSVHAKTPPVPIWKWRKRRGCVAD